MFREILQKFRNKASGYIHNAKLYSPKPETGEKAVEANLEDLKYYFKDCPSLRNSKR